MVMRGSPKRILQEEKAFDIVHTDNDEERTHYGAEKGHAPLRIGRATTRTNLSKIDHRSAGS